MEVRDAEYAANKTNDVTYDAKFTIRQNVFLASSGRLVINYGFSLFNIFISTDPMFACEYWVYIGWAVKPVITIILVK
jgi:hypothetical protein